MSNRRIRLLFVIGQLVQGGSERYLFELCRALDKDKFEIEVLTRRRTRPNDYYLPRLTELGIVVHRRLPLPLDRWARTYVPRLYRVAPFRRSMRRALDRQLEMVFGRFFDRYDLINCIQIESYNQLQHLLPASRRVLIHLMSARYQYPYDPYAECSPERHYHVVVTDPSQFDDLADSNCRNASSLRFPLVLDCRARPSVFALPPKGTPLRIGIFTRLSPEKPLEPLFFCFQSLVRDYDATLHVYGRGNPEPYRRLLDVLHIRERVFFEGHQVNLEETVRRERLSLGWLISNGPFLGYASIEVASYGMPMVFWNCLPTADEETLAQTGGAIHAFGNVVDFVNFNRELLEQPERLVQLGRDLRAYILAEYDVRHHIHVLEAHMVDLASAQPVLV